MRYKCGNCKFYEEDDRIPWEGVCRYNPPVYIDKIIEDYRFIYNGIFPKVSPKDDWCSKFIPKEL